MPDVDKRTGVLSYIDQHILKNKEKNKNEATG